MKNESINIECKPFGTTSEWQQTSVDDFLTNVRITKEIIEESGENKEFLYLYEEKNALDFIKSGRVITTPILEYRLASGKDCPICHSKFLGIGALSRRDNKTEICSQCGVNEALEDMAKATL